MAQCRKDLEIFFIIIKFGASLIIAVCVRHFMQCVRQNSWTTEKDTNIGPRKNEKHLNIKIIVLVTQVNVI